MLKTVLVMFWGPKTSALMVSAMKGNIYKHTGRNVNDAVFWPKMPWHHLPIVLNIYLLCSIHVIYQISVSLIIHHDIQKD